MEEPHRHLREKRYASPRSVPLEHDRDEQLVVAAHVVHRSLAAVAPRRCPSRTAARAQGPTGTPPPDQQRLNMPKTADETVVVNVRMLAALLKRLSRTSEALGISRAEAIRVAVLD